MNSSDAPIQEFNQHDNQHDEAGAPPVLESESSTYEEYDKREQERVELPLNLPEIPTTDLSFDFSSFIAPSKVDEEKVHKRASNVMKLAKENEDLERELKAMSERLEAIERRRAALAQKGQREEQGPSS